METKAFERTRRIAEAALDRKAKDVLALDVRSLTSFADSFVLLSGSSDRHVRSIADAVVEALRTDGEKPLGIEGYDDGRWVLIDANDVVVHVFLEEMREHYDLERLWGDAAVVEFGAPAPDTDQRTAP